MEKHFIIYNHFFVMGITKKSEINTKSKTSGLMRNLNSFDSGVKHDLDLF